jgi:hypothetical protein
MYFKFEYCTSGGFILLSENLIKHRPTEQFSEWISVLLEKLIVVQLFNEFINIYAKLNFVSMCR